MKSVFALCALGIAQPAFAGGPETGAVQNRLHTMHHEYDVALGGLPMDAFTKGVTLSGSYTLHFNDLFAWEVAQFTYSFPVDTKLQAELANLAQPVGPTPFEIVRYYGTSNFIFKPVYGKLSVLNRSVIYQELLFNAGLGVGRLTLTTRPVVDLGVAVRFYGKKGVSVRLDARDYAFINGDGVENELWFGLGLSLGHGQ